MTGTIPTVLIISYHFHPSNEVGARRPTALARFLAHRGIRVVVISAFGEQAIKSGSMILPGVVAVPIQRPSRKILDAMVSLKRKLYHSTTVPPQESNSHASRPADSMRRRSIRFWLRELYFQIAYFIDDYKGWGLRALRAALRESSSKSPELVFSSAPPLSMSWVGALTAWRLHIPHIMDLRDPWSDVIAHMNPHRRIELSLTRHIEQWLIHQAGAITSTSVTVANGLIHRQPDIASKTLIIRNGYDGTVHRDNLDTGGHLNILFAGELYLNRDPFPLLAGLERLLARPEVHAERISVTFMGRRTEQIGSAIEAWLKNTRCSSVVRMLDTQPPSVVAQATQSATVVLNLAQGQPLSVPAKTFEHLASGKENLLLCEKDAESAQLVAAIPGVIQVDPSDASALDQALLDLYERHVNQRRLRSPTESDVRAFSRAAANEQFWRVMIDLAPVLRSSSTEHLC